MTIKERIAADLTAAMKAGDKTRLGVLRMLKARMLELEVERRAKEGAGYSLDDAGALEAIAAYAKQRRDSIESYRQANREDLAANEEAELAIAQEFLPQPLSREDIARMAREAIAESGAKGPKEMGAVMKLLMPRLRGAADGKLVNEVVRELLGVG